MNTLETLIENGNVTVRNPVKQLADYAWVYEDGSTAWYNLYDNTEGTPEMKFHRLDGPAKELADGTKEWWVDGTQVTEEEYPQAVLNYKSK